MSRGSATAELAADEALLDEGILRVPSGTDAGELEADMSFQAGASMNGLSVASKPSSTPIARAATWPRIVTPCAVEGPKLTRVTV